MQNPYFVVAPGGTTNKLKVEFGLLALDLLDQRLQRSSISVEVFRTDFCAPARCLQQWVEARVREFGELASTLPSFVSLVKSLKSVPRQNENAN